MCNLRALKCLYFAFVRSILEYASIIWHPCYVVHIKRIESIQKKFLNFVIFQTRLNRDDQSLSYEEKCKLVSVDSLARRRIISNIYFMYDLLKGNIALPSLFGDVNRAINLPDRALRQNRFFNLNTRTRNYEINEPLHRMKNYFNVVAHIFNESPSRESFRLSIKRMDDSIFARLLSM